MQMARVMINGRMMTTTTVKQRGRQRSRQSKKAPRAVARSRAPTRRWGASHKGTKLNMWHEDDMRNALMEWRSEGRDSKRPLREIARAWNIPYATFRRRVLHTNKLKTGHCSGRPTVLNDTQENELAAHVRNLAAAGFPCDRTDVKNLAYEYAVKNGITGFSENKQNAGYYWFRGFIRRHKDLVMKKAENLSAPRAMCMNRQLIANWFHQYEDVVTRLGIKDIPSHLWNADETGCQNIHRADDVVGVVGKPSYNLTALEKGESSTALIAINAVGNVDPPMIIHRGKYIGKEWTNGAPQDTLVRVSEKGYVNKELFAEFGQLFIQYLQRQELLDGRPHLLLLDSHYSHLYNIQFLELMKHNNITVFALPPHTSHWMQPLDRGVFSSFKQAWQQEMKLFTRNTAGRKLEKKDFFRVFTAVWLKSVTVANAQGAFRGTGLFPVNLSAIPDHAFEPSSTTERERESSEESGQIVTTHPVNTSPEGNLNFACSEIVIDWSRCSGSTVVTDPVSGNDIIVGWCSQTDNSAIPLTPAGADVVISDNASSVAILVPPSGTDDQADGSTYVNVVSTDSSAATITDVMVNESSPGNTVNDTVSHTPCVSDAEPSQHLSKPVSFEDILPLPKRERPMSKRSRPKPPSYELTGDDTMQFVLDRADSCKKKRKSDEKKTKTRKLVKIKSSEVQTQSSVRRQASRKKSSKDSTVDVVPCALCNIRKCDDEYPRSWTQCQSCMQWYHNECQGLEENEPVDRFVCVECEDSG